MAGSIFDIIDVPVDLPYVRQVNKLVGASIVKKAGELRTTVVSIGGTSWKPEVPDCDSAKQMIEKK